MRSVIGKRSIYAAGIALALPFGLAACGDDEGTDEDETIVNTDNQDDNGGDDLNDDSDMDITPEEDQDTDTDTDDGGNDDALGGGSGDGEKPSREDVHAGIEMMLSEQLATMGLTEEQIEASGIGPAIDDYYTCVVDGIYDDASPQTLQVVAEGDPAAPVVGDEYQLLTDVSNGCVETELEPAMQG